MTIRVRDWAAWLATRLASEGAVTTSADLPLAEFQRTAASRLAEMVRQWGGALLADSVGLGKTRVALSVAVTLARERRAAGKRGAVWICAPARLRRAWRDAAGALGVPDGSVEVVSHAMLSRGRTPDIEPLVVVVDEAHRFRNPKTRRRATLAAHADVPLVLVTATPVANSRSDLLRLLELFLDDNDVRSAFGWDLQTAFALADQGHWDVTELVRAVTVRRTSPPSEASFGRRPSARLEVLGYRPSAEEAWLWRNLEPALGELELAAFGPEWPRGLLTEHVLRRWESGAEALRETAGDLRAYHERWLDAHRAGRSLDRGAFRSLFGGDDAQQVFPFVYGTDDVPGVDRAAAVERDLARLEELEHRTEAAVQSGFGRNEVIASLAKDGEPLLVFASYRRAAREVYEQIVSSLGPMARVGLLTGDCAEATGLGKTSAEDLLRRFAPSANGAHAEALREHERLQVLVATDCIAEGTNLQDCGRVVLADLPYTPLGIEQRVGRLLRPGGPHDTVTVYLPRPEQWNDSLGMRRRLGRKFDAATSAGMGSATTGFGGGVPEHDPLGALTALDSLATRFSAPDGVPPFAAVTERPERWIALADLGDGGSWLFSLSAEGDVDNDVARVVAELSDLCWDEREVRSVERPTAASDAVARRRSFLRAANAGPPPLSLDAPEVAAWRMLCAAAEELGLDADSLADLRERLLHRHRLGVRRRLALHVESGAADRLVGLVRELAAPVEPDVELVAALGL